MKISKLKFYNFKTFLVIISAFFILSACSKNAIPGESPEKTMAENVKEKKQRPLQIPEPKLIDILHTSLDLSFNWEKQEVFGKAQLTIKSRIQGFKKFYLDAKSMEISKVSVSLDEKYLWKNEYDGKRIYLSSDSTINRNDVFTIDIEYIARPSKFIDSLSPEDRGLFFIDPFDSISGISPQIWTQGETEFNSVWFPTLDRPDEKFNQDIFITVDTALVTLSNGKLLTKSYNKDGTRTDHWVQQKPHSAYLVMLAVGDWDIIELKSESVPLYVYTESKYKESIDDVFKNTSEMINFFSSRFGQPFPWEKYAQIPVRKFVTGAMENTSASVFMDNLYVNKKELVDENFDWIISHELVHQWFGDMVTCESWAYISLNESFANYGEYLWSEYKYGEEAAGLNRIAELDEYFSEARSYKAPIVRHRYHHPDDLFDAHSYSKGGLVLHMLRNELGDEVFFESLKLYLRKFKYQNVELSDLRKVFEEVSGKDLYWFFDQWFEKPGHPVLKIKYTEKPDHQLIVEFAQTQKENEFTFPLKLVYLYSENEKIDTLINVNNRTDSISWKLPRFGGTLIADPGHYLLADISIKKTFEELFLQYNASSDFLNRYDAFELLLDSFPDRVKNSGLAQSFLMDESYTIQELTLDFIESEYEILGTDTERRIKDLAKKSNKSYVRGAAIETLMYLSHEDSTFYEYFLDDSSWYVNAIAIEALLSMKEDSLAKLDMIKSFEESNNPHVVYIVASYYASSSLDKSQWFNEKLQVLANQHKYAILSYYGLGMLQADSSVQQNGLDELYRIATSDEFTFNRVMAYQSLLVYLDRPEVRNQLVEILKREDADAIREWFSEML